MSDSDQKDPRFLTETDKLLMKLDEIIISIKGKEGAIDYKSVQDGFDKLRFKLNEKLKEAETLMDQRDKLLNSTVPKEIFDRKTLEVKLEGLLEDIDKALKELELELKAQKKKKGKYGDFTNKDKMKSLLDQKYQLLRSKMDGMQVEEKLIEDNRTSMEQLESILAVKEGSNDVKSDRELNDLEKAKMEEWDREKEEQDKDLDELGGMIKQLGHEVKLASDNIAKVNKTVKKVSKSTDRTTAKVESQNKKLKDLLNKIRSGDKICVDIVLILILLGLIAVLYNLIKSL